MGAVERQGDQLPERDGLPPEPPRHSPVSIAEAIGHVGEALGRHGDEGDELPGARRAS
jgi:hypothetical protein